MLSAAKTQHGKEMPLLRFFLDTCLVLVLATNDLNLNKLQLPSHPWIICSTVFMLLSGTPLPE